MSYQFGFLIESMVAVLLLLTILYCVRLNNQLRLLKADERSLKATIAELVTATENAERAIGGLKGLLNDGQDSLGGRLADAEQLSSDLRAQIEAGQELLARLVRIAAAARPGQDQAEGVVPPPDAKTVAAAAQAFAERAQARIRGLAA